MNEDVAGLVERLFWSHERSLTVEQAHAAADAMQAQAAEIERLRGCVTMTAAWERRALDAEAEIERLRLACSKLNEDISQTLGKALNYPWFKDDKKNFPDATESDGVCVGDHVAESIASEAATTIERMRATVNKSIREVARMGRELGTEQAKLREAVEVMQAVQDEDAAVWYGLVRAFLATMEKPSDP